MRIVALSDQHGYLPEIPPCDLLLVAGDVCPDRIGNSFAEHHPDRQMAWFDERARPWLAGAPAAHKILTWGNHDWCGQAYPAESGTSTAASPGGLQILVDAAARVPAPGMPGGSVSVWGSPWSLEFGHWAFMKPPDELAKAYAAIPDDIDILVSHQPPYGYGDRFDHVDSGAIEHVGSEELLAAIRRIRPRLVICGHMHGGHGRYEYEGVIIHNVAVVNDDYRLARPPTLIDLPGR